MTRWRLWFRHLFRRSASDAALDRELQACVDILTAEKIQAGLPPAEARRQALLETGSLDVIKEHVRDGRPGAAIQALRRDLRQALRGVLRRPFFAATAVLSLSLGIGAATAVYSWGSAMFFRVPTGVPDPQSLVAVFLDDDDPDTDYNIISIAHLEELRASQTVFSDIAGTVRRRAALAVDGRRAQETTVEFVTGGFFPTVNMPLAAGRGLAADDDVPGAPFTVVLSHRLWKTAFAGTPDVVGRTLRLNGHQATIVGVADPAFEGLDYSFYGTPDIWASLRSAPALLNVASLPVRSALLRVYGRLNAGVTRAEAEAALTVAAAQISHQPSDSWRYTTARVRPLEDARVPLYTRETMRTAFNILIIVTCLLVGAGCFNIANFLISQGITRRTEMGVRIALGATRRQLFQQLFTECGVLGVAGGAGGLMFAVVFARVLELYPLNSGLGNTLDVPVAIDVRAGLFAWAVALAATLTFGPLPAAMTSYRSPVAGRTGFSQWSSARGVRSRQVLLGVQVAVSLVLTVVAALFATSLLRLERLVYPYPADTTLLARVNPDALQPDERRMFYRDLLPRVRAHGAVAAVGLSFNPPLSIGSARAQRAPGAPEAWEVSADYTTVGPGFFEALQIPVTSGREFRDDDDPMAVTIVNATAAQRLWPGENPIGRTVRYRIEPNHIFTVVGVVDQPRCQDRMTTPHPCVYLPARLDRGGAHTLVIRTNVSPAVFAPDLSSIVRDLNPDVVVDRVVTLDAHLNILRADARVAAMMTGGAAALAGLLVAIGCAALLLSLVRETQREIAIRLALGSTAGRLTGHIMARALVPYVAGMAGGLAASWLVVPHVGSRLYETGVREPGAFIVPAVSMLVVGLAAAYWPTLVANRTNPADLLRD